MSNTLPSPAISEDTLEGTAKIAAFIGKTVRQTIHLLEIKQLPAFKLGGRWHMRCSRYAAHVEQLEASAMETSDHPKITASIQEITR